MRAISLFLFVTAAATAQPFSVGLKAGVPLTDFFKIASNPTNPFRATTNRYIFGASAELRLPAGLGVELDVLYRHLNYSTALGSASGNAFEFPLLAKYRFPGILVRPFVDAGISFDSLGGLRSLAGARKVKDFNTGGVIGIGLDIHPIFLHITPEFRYTRWGSEPFRDPLSLIRSSKNQAEFLVGFTF